MILLAMVIFCVSLLSVFQDCQLVLSGSSRASCHKRLGALLCVSSS